MAEDSKGDRIPFGTRLCWQSLVCYTFMKQTEYGNGEFPSDERTISVLFCAKGCSRRGRNLSKEKGTGGGTCVTEPVPARSAEERYIKKTNERLLPGERAADIL